MSVIFAAKIRVIQTLNDANIPPHAAMFVFVDQLECVLNEIIMTQGFL